MINAGWYNSVPATSAAYIIFTFIRVIILPYLVWPNRNLFADVIVQGWLKNRERMWVLALNMREKQPAKRGSR